MSDILDRLRARVHPHFFTNAVAANLGACAVNPAVIHAQTGTVTIGGPDKDMQDAIAEIERLRACISEERNALAHSERMGVRQADLISQLERDLAEEKQEHRATLALAADVRAYAVALKDAAQGVADLCGPPLDKDEREFVMHLDRLHSLLKVDCGHEIWQVETINGGSVAGGQAPGSTTGGECHSGAMGTSAGTPASTLPLESNPTPSPRPSWRDVLKPLPPEAAQAWEDGIGMASAAVCPQVNRDALGDAMADGIEALLRLMDAERPVAMTFKRLDEAAQAWRSRHVACTKQEG
jgi:hypothetical protein